MALNRDRTRLRRLCRIAVSLIVMTTAMATRQARAQSWQSNLEVPPSAFFGGIGFGINRVNFGHQSLDAIGTSKNYADGNLVSIGSAGGPGSVDPSNATTASPELRFGYYRRIGTSPWLWGFKVSYADLQAEETSINVGIPQAGVIAYASPRSLQSFTGVAVMQSYQVKADSRFSAGPFIGYTIGPGFLYLGVGGPLTHAETDLNDLVGYATINGQNVNVSGAPQSFASSGWVLGAGVTLGASYFVARNWFVDLAYSFAETAAQIGRYQSSFTNSTTNPGVTTTGNLYGQSSEKIMTNSITLTFNRAF